MTVLGYNMLASKVILSSNHQDDTRNKFTDPKKPYKHILEAIQEINQRKMIFSKWRMVAIFDFNLPKL